MPDTIIRGVRAAALDSRVLPASDLRQMGADIASTAVTIACGPLAAVGGLVIGAVVVAAIG